MRLLLVVSLALALAPRPAGAEPTARPGRPTCLTTYGRTACGYSCLAAHGELGCARTSRGTCAPSGTGVVCWDPPEHVRAHYGDATPRPECVTRSGTTACGYRCVAHDEDVACATTPDGICEATSLGISCWDPPPAVYCADDRSLPRPQCVSLDGVLTCGYGCLARNGHAACALTPAGRCEIGGGGRIVCFDPELPPMCGATTCAVETETRSWCPPPER